jgi:hypothetical protein
MSKKRFKRAISPIRLVLIALLMAGAILGIMYLVQNNLLSEKWWETSLDQSNGLEIRSAYVEDASLNVVVKDNLGEESRTGIKFIFYNGTDNISVERYVALEKSEEKIFTFNSIEIPGITNYDKVSVVPIYGSDAEKEKEDVSDTKDIVKRSTPSVSSGDGGGSGDVGDSGDGGSGGESSGSGTDDGGDDVTSDSVCGDGTCDADENCSACSNDCGVCNLTCTCGSWTDNVCGGGSCTSTQMQQIRTCDPSSCETETQCVSDASCEPPTCTPGEEVCDGEDNNCDGEIDEGGVCPPPSGEFLNEPAHLIKLGEHGFPLGYVSEELADTATYTAPGTDWWYKRYDKHSLDIPPRHDAPMSPPGTMEMHYPTGMPTSGEPAAFNFYMPEQRELYVSYHFLMPSNPESGKWELEPVGVKILGYISFGDVPGGQQNYGTEIFKPGGLQSGPFGIRVNEVVGNPGNSVCPWYEDFIEEEVIYLDQWHQVEMYFKINDLGLDNGIHQIWVDGLLYKDCQKMSFLGPMGTHGFWQVHFQPVLGGYTPGWSKTQDDYVYLDHIYVSGLPK